MREGSRSKIVSLSTALLAWTVFYVAIIIAGYEFIAYPMGNIAFYLFSASTVVLVALIEARRRDNTLAAQIFAAATPLVAIPFLIAKGNATQTNMLAYGMFCIV